MDIRTGFTTLIAALLASAGLAASAQGLAPDCAAIKEANSSAGDGTYIIAPGGNPFQVHCHDMAGAPREYLTLPNTGGGFNYSTHGDVGGFPVVPVTTHYTRVRIDPATLLVNTGDQTFSSTVGADCCYGNTMVVSMPYAVAASCRGAIDDGNANVDLTGLPFKVDDVFTLVGWFAYGSANSGPQLAFFDSRIAFAVQAQVVTLTGGGSCGGIGPRMAGPGLNGDGGFDLQLAYTGNPGIGKDSCKSGGWQAFGVFRNQGDCVSYFATGGRNAPSR